MTKRISNLIELLRGRAARRPLQEAYTFLRDGEAEEVTLTYERVERRARAIAARLQAIGVAGERVLLLYPHGPEYVSAFWGCVYAGAVAVPAYPPRQNRSLLRLQAVAADAQSTLALTTPALLSKVNDFTSQCAGLEGMRWLATETVPDEAAGQWRRPDISADNLAFLQYTSGSTSAPKGVMVTHGNLLDNEGMIQEAFGQTERSVIVGWLPLYHDMGLIGNVLQPVYAGARCVLMSPVSFLQDPSRWLTAISRYRATTSGGPNFAYDLCVRKVDPARLESLDLSSWEVAFNGAEPVRAETMKSFAETFGPYGFDARAFRPCYGLAEATLLVSCQSPAHDAPAVKTVDAEALQGNAVVEVAGGAGAARSLVGCGAPASGQEVYVYRPETQAECLPGEVGEICVAGPNVTKGYWNRPAETERAFEPHRAAGRGGTLLRTGDLGVLLDGELFVTGRLKDLVIIRGRNHYPHDIERTVEQSHASLRPGCGAVFTVEVGGEERLVVAQEVAVRRPSDTDAIIRAIREAVADEHELGVHAVALVKTGGVPKTSSGKIQRSLCREKFLSNGLDVIAAWESTHAAAGTAEPAAAEPDVTGAESAEAWLRAELASALGVRASDIEVNRPLSDYALDSLAAIELAHRIEAKLGLVLPMATLLRGPTVAELAALARPAEAEPAAPLSAPPRSAADPRPLSRGQQALWFIHQLAPDSSAYNIATAVRIASELDVAALRRAFRLLLERHPALRSVFAAHGDEPTQRVLEDALLPFEEVNAEGLSEESFKYLLADGAERRFDLGQRPPLRVQLFKRAHDEYVLLLVVHHIAADFWSLSVMAHELGQLYTAEAAGTSAELPENRLQYDDYVRRQEEVLGGPEGERLWSYWREQLAGELPALDLPTDRPRPPAQTYRGASEGFRLSAELTRGLKELSRAQGTTLYVTLLAAFQTLLYRYTGQEDILVGSPTAGRGMNGLGGLVGYFVNPVVVRGRPSGADSFASFLAQTKQTVLSALAHQDYPFPLLVERLQPERDAGRSPLFQVMFILQRSHLLNEKGLGAFALGEAGARMKLGALELESMALARRVSQFDLTLAVAESGDALSASLQYNADLFEPETVRRMARHLETLLGGIVERPRQRLSELPLLTPDERRRLVVDWNQTDAAYPQQLCLHELFEAQAARTPDAVALVHGGERLSYVELNERANRLAHRLRSLGAGPEVYVGLLLNRNVELVVALLAVLKSGSAYLPLEPAYPAERLSFMLRDTRARILVTEESLLGFAGGLLPPQDAGARWPARVVCLEREREAVRRLPASAPPAAATSGNAAYVIFTSGSTGKPKGVVINHSSAVVMAQWAGEVFTPAQLAGVLAATSVSFDLSVFELFAPLSVGGAVILAENALQLPALSAVSEVTLVNTVPSAMAELVRGGTVPAGVATVNLAGEALPRELVEQLYGLGTVKQVYNLYGPSEDTTYSTYALVAPGEQRPPAIGRPLPNTRAYVLDAYAQPVPAGVTGELYLGGEGLARCYLNRPALTAERFVPDPFGPAGGGRLYRTGDLVRYTRDGVLEYVGRADHQVKIRGFRVELGEVEAALRRYEQVREAVVTVSERRGGEKVLAAYVVLKDAAAGGGAEGLREWMRRRLPAQMVPQAFVLLDELPLTPNGKVDRRALPACPEPGAGRVETRRPETQTETAVAEVWREVLGVERVGADDNFFDLGGHSLLATRLISQARRRFGVEVALRDFFERATVGGLARLIEDAAESGRGSDSAPIKPAPRVGPLRLSSAQQRLWFLDQLGADSTAYNMPAAARLTGELDVDALERSLSEIISRHEVLRTVFAEEGDEPTQIILPAVPARIPLIDLSTLDLGEREAEVRRRATAEAQKPFDLGRGPLIRFTLLRLSAREHVLLLTVHHIAFDGWSVGVLIGELSALYAAYSGGGESPLAALPIQYADYAAWQREWLRGEASERQLDYWRRQLAQAPEALNLPTDKPRPAVLGASGLTEQFRLPPALVASLKALGQEEGATLFMVLLAAFQVLLSRYAGQQEVSVGTAVSSRNRAEVEGLIGFFVNMLVMRGDLGGDPSFREHLGRVREVALEAYAHQDVPFESLVEALQVKRSLNRAPLFQVAFVLQNAPEPEPALAGVRLERLEVDAGRAQFDLNVSMSETPDGGVAGSITYNTDLFYASTVVRMHEHFRALLEALASHPEANVSEVSFLTADEREDLLLARDRGASPYPQLLCLHELFEARAALTPSATALTFEGASLSYAELNSRANRLARHLVSLGVGTETLVGVLMERSAELVVSLLAVLKAGAAYLPLDPAYPRERLAFMLEDSKAAVLLTQAGLLDSAPAHRGQTFCVDAQRAEVEGLSGEDPGVASAPENLAYVIYTSGSTGRPKGVMVTHANVARLLRASEPLFGFDGSDVWTLFHSYAFDFSVWELWGALAYGGRLVVVPYWVSRSPEAFARLLVEEGVTVLNQTPSAFYQLAQADAREPVEGLALRYVIFGGEALDLSRLKPWYQRRDEGWPRLVNMYGITETTVHVTARALTRRDAEEAAGSLIGGALADLRLYVLDRHLQPVPAGVAGELYVGGDGLARGYLNRPALTAERFIPDPFSGRPGERLYRSGDVVRRRADGEMEYVGRGDEQVKVRGYRIELGEIEAALLRHEGVRDCVVLAREEAVGDKRLVAYVVGAEAQAPAGGELRGFLKESLPDHMIPAAFVPLERIPLTANGKLDRRALPAPEPAGPAEGREYVAPRTPTEELLAGVWGEVLGSASPGVRDDFFELGGHSLLATQLMSQVRKRFGVEVALRSFFESPTVEGLARMIDDAGQASAVPAAPTIKRASREHYRMNTSRQGAMLLPEALRKDAARD